VCVLVQSVIDEEAKGDSAKHVFISGQTTHITIEEEHPGGEDLKSDSPAEDDDFDVDIQALPAVKHGNCIIVLSMQTYFVFVVMS